MEYAMRKSIFISLALFSLSIGASGTVEAMAKHKLTQVINKTETYVTHYGYFPEPDPALPSKAVYMTPTLDIKWNLNPKAPIGKQVFVAGEDGAFQLKSSTYKSFAYELRPT